MTLCRFAFLSMSVLLLAVSCGQDASFQDITYGHVPLGAGESASSLDSTANSASDSEATVDSLAASSSTEDTAEAGGDADQSETDTDGVEQSSVGVPSSISPAELAIKCANTEVVEYKQLISFPSPQNTCAWGTDANPNLGNLGKKDQRVSARHQQDAMLNIPENALICSLNMNFISDGSAGQQMYYDDEIFMTFNDVVLAASQSYETEFAKKDGFMVYDWTKMVGKKYGHALYEPYCVGADKGQGECFIPPTETNGIMKVNFSDAIVQGIAASTGVKLGDDKALPVNKTNFKFSFVTIGDNDSPIDCKHSKFEFRVAAKYVVFK